MANKKFLDFEGVRHLWSKINMQDYPNNDMLMNVIQAIDDTKADRDELLQNKEEITGQESYELQFKLKLPSVTEYVYTGDNISGGSAYGHMCSKFSKIEQAMGVPAAYSSTAPNALAELIAGCMTACSDTPDSMIYNNILPRITLNFPNLVAAGAWSSGILLTTYSISDYSRTTGDKITFFIKYDSETDEYTLQRRSPSWGVLVFNSQNVVLLNQMSKFDDTLTDSKRSPSAAVVGEALQKKIEREDLVQPDWDVVDSTSLAYIKNRTHGRYHMIPDCQNTTIPELGYTPLNTWPSDIYETEAYNSFIALSGLSGIIGGGSTTRRYDFSFTMTSGVVVRDYSYKGDKIQANAIMIDEYNYKCNIATNGSLVLFFINNLETLSDEYKDTFDQPGIYLYCSSETYKAGLSNIHSMVYNYTHLDTDYLSPLPEYLIPNEIARAETVVTHTSNEVIHVTAEEKEAWNNKAEEEDLAAIGNALQEVAETKLDKAELDPIAISAALGIVEPIGAESPDSLYVDENNVIYIF